MHVFLLLLTLLGCPPDEPTPAPSDVADGSDLTGSLLFSEVYNGDSIQMWLYAFESGSVSELTADDNVYWYGRWSPDNSRIGLSRHTDVYVMDNEGSGIRKIIGGNGQQIHPAWGPDGRTVVYQGHAKPDYEIYTIDVDDEEADRVPLTENESNDYTPDWSPNGDFIIMVRDIGDRKQLIRLDLATGTETQLTSMTGDCERPRISPDSQTVAFQRTINGLTSVYTMAADGSGEPKALTSSGYNLMPAWSPDGRYLAYVGEESGQIDVFVINLQGDQVFRVTDDYYEERDLDWRF